MHLIIKLKNRTLVLGSIKDEDAGEFKKHFDEARGIRTPVRGAFVDTEAPTKKVERVCRS